MEYPRIIACPSSATHRDPIFDRSIDFQSPQVSIKARRLGSHTGTFTCDMRNTTPRKLFWRACRVTCKSKRRRTRFWASPRAFTLV